MLTPAGAGGARPAAAQTPVDLELVLAIDSSASVNYQEFNLQVLGLAGAFRDAGVVEAISGGQLGRISVMVMEWSSSWNQQITVPWMMVADGDTAEAVAAQIEATPRLVEPGATSISGALAFATRQFGSAGFVGTRRVIDLSGDGHHNQGLSLSEARARTMALGVTINGLAILNEQPELDMYYQEQVIGGFGAFVERANDYEDYARAIRRKLIREIMNVPIAGLPGAADQRADATPASTAARLSASAGWR